MIGVPSSGLALGEPGFPPGPPGFAEWTPQVPFHPEVHLCLGCAHFVHQQAWVIEDEGRRGPAAFARDRFRNLRAEVIRRGWHQNRFIGGRLRWLGKYRP